MKTRNFFVAITIAFFAYSCTNDYLIDSPEMVSENNILKSASTHLKIAVVSDIHYLDPSLLPDDISSSPTFQMYLAQDPKLIEFSDPILREVISELISQKPDMVLIPGDLTKDGEKLSHESVATILKQLTDNQIKVFVVPGNHDINNPEAFSYKINTPVESIVAEDFASLYGDFGYNDALYRDENSLSYICQPFSKLWILGIDACKYEENTTAPIVGGAIKAGTMSWIQEKMAEAREKNITVLPIMHHGIMEHYNGQNSLDAGYVVDNWPETSAALMEAGIKVVFTGHYHANDISELTYNGETISDIETGSLVTPPSPYRIMTLDDNFINVDTKQVTNINVSWPAGMDFCTYSNLFLTGHLDAYFNYVLYYNFGVPAELAATAAPLFRNAIMAHYSGDEKLMPAERKKIDALGKVAPPFLTGALYSLWTDQNPKDNKTHIKLK